MSYLRNTWYVAAHADEVKAGVLFQRRLLEERIVLFRDAAGSATALLDRCANRFAPLRRVLQKMIEQERGPASKPAPAEEIST